MDGTITRYAVYFAPEPGSALARFGAGWLGWDASLATVPEPPAVPGIDPADREALTLGPRRYGFHGTLKAPFRLAGGATPAALSGAVAAIAARVAPFALPPLKLAEIGDFLALVPSQPSAPLDALAAACVTELDGFRAPMDDAERARRGVGLGPRATAHLERWGYPHVLDRFRFHLTLTGPAAPAIRTAVRAALVPVLAPILAERQCFTAISLFGEVDGGAFRELERLPLAEGP
jgi:putative phosphonate metabolism protein